MAKSTDSPDARIRTFGGCFPRVFGAGIFFMGTIGAAGLIFGNAVPTYVFVLLLILVITFLVIGAWCMFGYEEIRIYGAKRRIEFVSAFGRWRHYSAIEVPFGASIVCVPYANLEKYGTPTCWRVDVQSIDRAEVVRQLSEKTAIEIATECRKFIGDDVTIKITPPIFDA